MNFFIVYLILAAATKSFSAFLCLLLALLLSLSISAYTYLSLFFSVVFFGLSLSSETRVFRVRNVCSFSPFARCFRPPLKIQAFPHFAVHERIRRKGRGGKGKKKEIHTDSSRNCNKHVNARGLPRARFCSFIPALHTSKYIRQFLQSSIETIRRNVFAVAIFLARRFYLKLRDAERERATVIFVLPYF